MGVWIWYSALSTAAVTAPPRDAAPLKVTKSSTLEPCPVSVTVIKADPFVAAKVTSPAEVVARMGVISL